MWRNGSLCDRYLTLVSPVVLQLSAEQLSQLMHEYGQHVRATCRPDLSQETIRKYM